MSDPIAILRRDLAAIRGRARARGVRLPRLQLSADPYIEEARREGNRRWFASVMRFRGSRKVIEWKILFARALARERRPVRLGVLYHEVGHVLVPQEPVGISSEDSAVLKRMRAEAGKVYRTKAEAEDQAQANFAAWEKFGVRIRYDRRGVEYLRVGERWKW